MNQPRPDASPRAGAIRPLGPGGAVGDSGSEADDSAADPGSCDPFLTINPPSSGAAGRPPDDEVPGWALDLPEALGAVIGPYKLLRPIGEGGMGTVFLAEQERPLRRQVALKIIKPGMDTRRVVARFEAERQALALMDHPNIARVLDAGATSTGRPYFVMELVHGVPITEFCDRHRLTPRERLELFLPVCRAIQHAHQKGVIHRDIKPTNVLVALQDGRPEPKVIDFGVAKATERGRAERTAVTECGAVIGTLEYMSPEQAEPGSLDIDTRSDIYSLGVLLYELLTGSTPLGRSRVRQADPTEILRRIREEEPPRPSARLAEAPEALPSIAARRRTDSTQLPRLVRGDLDWIAMKALEKDRGRRYETANGLARDVRRHLDGDPVEASPPSAGYRLGKFTRRNRIKLAVGGSFALLLILATATSVGLAYSTKQRRRVEAAEAEATRQRQRAEDREEMALEALVRFGGVILENEDLKHNPTLVPLRRALLQEPRAYFDRLRAQLEADRDTKPESLARLAHACSSLGSFLLELGNDDQAARAFGQASAILDGLARQHPAVLDYRRDQGEALGHVGQALLAAGRWDEARAAFERERASRAGLVQDRPGDEAFQRDLASAERGIGLAERGAGHWEPALLAFERARRIDQALADDRPGSPVHEADLAATAILIGSVEAHASRPEAALAAFERARAGYERLVARDPAHAGYASGLADAQVEIATTVQKLGRLAEARARLDEARATVDGLVQRDPHSIPYKTRLRAILNLMAKISEDLDELDQANVYYKQAKPLREWLEAHDPTRASIDARLRAIRLGQPARDNSERLLLAQRSYELFYYRMAVRLYDEALRHDPELGRDRRALVAYRAARCAVMASRGWGRDDLDLEPATCSRLRNQALAWLRGELAVWRSVLARRGAEAGSPVLEMLGEWRRINDLDSVRSESELTKLPPDEQADWRRLWAEVDSLIVGPGGANHRIEPRPNPGPAPPTPAVATRSPS